MDPNAALAQLRAILETARAEDRNLDRFDAACMDELFSGLDQWLSSGGFLPDAWKR